MKKKWKKYKEVIIATPEELFQRFLGRSFRQSSGDPRRRVVESDWWVSSWKPPRPGPGPVWSRIAQPPDAPGASPTAKPPGRRPPPPAEKSLNLESETSGALARSLCCVTSLLLRWFNTEHNKTKAYGAREKKKG